MASRRALLVHERSVAGAVIRSYLVGSRLVMVRGPTEDEYLSEYAAVEGSAGEGDRSASELCTYYGVPTDSVTVRVTKPEGRTEAGRYKLADCGIRLLGPSRKMSGGWPRSERQWRELYLTAVSQMLAAATLPTLDVATTPPYKYWSKRKTRKTRRQSKKLR